jgi:hypothetical protein
MLKAIYANDDRREVSDSANDPAMAEAARSTGVLVFASSLKNYSNDEFKLESVTYGKRWDLCKEERFIEQPSAGVCSGFLVGPDLFVTAGHCIQNAEQCSKLKVVFDYSYQDSTHPVLPLKTNVYSCKKVLAAETGTLSGADYSIIQLDRSVDDREPLKLNDSDSFNLDLNLTVISYPLGLPAKIAAGARVRSAENAYFVATTDSFEGSSGAPVLNSATGEVEGIVSRGDEDFVKHELAGGGRCRSLKRCTENGCFGEDITKASVIGVALGKIR